MRLKKILKSSETVRGLFRDYKSLKSKAVFANKKKIVSKYFLENKVTKLQIGSHSSIIKGWLSTDLIPVVKECIPMDATKPFPFKSATFDYVYSEHMIEHVSWLDGLAMLKESYRVLKPNGKIRIATPDLKVFIDIYCGENRSRDLDYIKWITDRFLNEVDIYEPGLVVNNVFRNWHHQFIYDEHLLSLALENAGFKDIRKQKYGHSKDNNLRNLEHHGINIGNIEMAVFETLILEGTKV